jgi:hypothetical protein
VRFKYAFRYFWHTAVRWQCFGEEVAAAGFEQRILKVEAFYGISGMSGAVAAAGQFSPAFSLWVRQWYGLSSVAA